jgi:glycosyltransferase involved in cell wall biosynthesis
LSDGFSARGYIVELVSVSEAADPHPLKAEYTTKEHILFKDNSLYRTLRRISLGPLHFRGARVERLRLLAKKRAIQWLELQAKNNPGSIFIAMEAMAAQLVAASKLQGSKFIVQYHNSFRSLQNSADLARIRQVSRKADVFLALTRGDADAFRSDAFHNVNFVGNPLPFFPKSLPESRMRTVISIGRYQAQKAYDVLITAWSKIDAKQREGWSLHLHGSGHDEGKLRDLVHELGEEKSISIHGVLNDVPSELLKASIFALSSAYEGLPMVLVEAMACGLPCVATDCSEGVRELIAEGITGNLVPVGDTSALANRLAKLMGDAEGRITMGLAGRRTASRYSLSSKLDEWESLFKWGLIGQRSAAT